MTVILEFERDIADLEAKIAELRRLEDGKGLNIAEEIKRLEGKCEKLLKQKYSKLSDWQKVLVARHPGRPHTSDILHQLLTDFTPLAGDRLFAEDLAIIGGIGRFKGQSVVILGHEKGHETETRVKHNFGMAKPEGYRKAQRLYRLAERFQLPIITLVDTPGAYPGVGAEERGQAEAIAQCIDLSFQLTVPILSIIIGEGGSGGAIALATANRVFMLEHAVYSVISPEGCASILWKDAEKANIAAQAQKLTAEHLLKLGIIDAIIDEPLGGAHRNQHMMIQTIGLHLEQYLKKLATLSKDQLREERRNKFLRMGQAKL